MKQCPFCKDEFEPARSTQYVCMKPACQNARASKTRQKYYQAHKQELIANQKLYQVKNRERILAWDREYKYKRSEGKVQRLGMLICAYPNCRKEFQQKVIQQKHCTLECAGYHRAKKIRDVEYSHKRIAINRVLPHKTAIPRLNPIHLQPFLPEQIIKNWHKL